MAEKHKNSSSDIETIQDPKKTKLQPPLEVKPNYINTLFDSPGFNHITGKLLWLLDDKSLSSCRLVCDSWRARIDHDPYFWIKKCDEKPHIDNNFVHPEELHDAFIHLAGKIEKGSLVEQDFSVFLMKWYGLKCNVQGKIKARKEDSL